MVKKNKVFLSDKIYFLVVVLFVLSILCFLLTLYLISALEKKEIDLVLRVGEVMGFDVSNASLIFGIVIPGHSSQREIILENDYNFPIYFEFKVKGDIKEFLVFDRIVPLDIGEKKILGVSAVVPLGEEFNNYSGKMIVLIKKDFSF